ncbi:hypothetical protein EHS89_02865 [Amphritea balenae]|uniref:Zinc finger CCCH-type TRM13 domain-containing protein n=1 Tax=Amphritea balenae TaxID=452629 RepID=A0A3P1SX62_9GAMM|nr:hypothetical protein EHS89_02865 [Amphritea balenae]
MRRCDFFIGKKGRICKSQRHSSDE